MERPKICCVDLTKIDFETLEKNDYNLFEGSLGATMLIPNKSRGYSANLLLDYSLPENYHEFDILILDLTNETKKDYKPNEHKVIDTKRNEVLQLVCSYPTTIFDPRPLTSSFLRELLESNHNRKFLQIIFACQSYEITYEKVLITDDYPRQQPSETHNIYSFMRNSFLSNPRYGKEVTVDSVRNGDLLSLLSKHASDISYHQTFNHPSKYYSQTKEYGLDEDFIPLLKNINEEIVSFAYINENHLTFVFPNINDKSGFLTVFLKNVAPSFLPELFPFSTQFKWTEAKDYFLPNHSLLLDEKEKLAEEFKKKNEEIEKKITENISRHQFLHELLTETGDALVHAIYKFLKWIEFSTVIIKDEHSNSILEEDLQIEHEKGLLIIETKGIGGTSTDSDCSQISKIKHRRCEERNAFDVSALYIVNHERYLPPLKRKNPPFNEHQIKDAINDKRGLLTTWQLYNLYFEIENAMISKEDARREFLKYGLVEFKPKTKDKLVPKEILKQGYVIIADINKVKLKVGQVLIAEKNGKYFKAKIISIRLNDKPVDEVEDGEVGFGLDVKISGKTTLWTEQNGS